MEAKKQNCDLENRGSEEKCSGLISIEHCQQSFLSDVFSLQEDCIKDRLPALARSAFFPMNYADEL